MRSEFYEIVALTARYLFAGLMALIVLRAARGAALDARRAAKLRRLSPMTGLSGELVVLVGTARVPRERRFPVIREGTIGSSRYADVRLRARSVRRRHVFFQLTEQGLALRGHAGATFRFCGRERRQAVLRDGDEFEVGGIRLLLVLTDARGSETSRENADDIFYTHETEPYHGVKLPFDVDAPQPDPDARYQRPRQEYSEEEDDSLFMTDDEDF